MITMLLGAPGSGKSYEATVFQVLPALRKGRKVITNLPLNVDAFAELNEDYRALIELRQPTAEDLKPFSKVSDYKSDWKHPTEGFGPLFVVDECHMFLPMTGTPRDLEEWFALHRHENVDVVLITQTYGKVNKNIRELVQTVIELRKNTNLGSQKTYRREVRDSLRKGNRLGLEVRQYKKQYFPLYQSYTKGGRGVEAGVSDVKPLWRHPVFYLLGVMLVFLGYQLTTGGFSIPGFSDKPAPAAPLSGPAVPYSGPPVPVSVPAGPVVAPPAANSLEAAFGRPRIVGRVGDRILLRVRVGDREQFLGSDELERRGVHLMVMAPCLARLIYKTSRLDVSCDA